MSGFAFRNYYIWKVDVGQQGTEWSRLGANAGTRKAVNDMAKKPEEPEQGKGADEERDVVGAMGWMRLLS